MNIAGIPIEIKGSALALLLLSAIVGNPLHIILLFAFITIHEFGHIGAASRYGLVTHRIELHWYGGAAIIPSVGLIPKQELQIALAGPAVSLLLAGIFAAANSLQPVSVLSDMVDINLMIAAFNMLPIFPLDGGRVLRSLLAMRGSARATLISLRIGLVVSIAAFIALDFALMPGILAILMILFNYRPDLMKE